MKYIILIFILLLSSDAAAQPGSFDNVFGQKKKGITIDFTNRWDHVRLWENGQALVAQSDGKFIIAGPFTSSDLKDNFGGNIQIIRFSADGYIDPSFGSQGKISTSLTSYKDHGTGLAL